MATLAAGGLLPSVRGRFEIRAGIVAALQGREASSRSTTAGFRRNWAVNKGAQLSPRSATPPEKFRIARWEDFPRPWSCDKVNAEYIRRFLALARSRDIPVYWLLPPVSPELQA